MRLKSYYNPHVHENLQPGCPPFWFEANLEVVKFVFHGTRNLSMTFVEGGGGGGVEGEGRQRKDIKSPAVCGM